MNRVLVTGANGFVASALAPFLTVKGYMIRSATRSFCNGLADNREVGDIGSQTDWSSSLSGVDYVIHLAARVHMIDDQSSDPLVEFRRVNLDGTRRLAEQAVVAGVKRFVFVSTIKVNGEETGEVAFRACDKANPQDPYAVSKFEAECALQQVCEETGMEWVIIRPPLVYGAGVKGNFARLMTLVAKKIPLPFRASTNVRSLVSVYNLSDLIIKCLESPVGANKVFLVSDHEDVSVGELFAKMALAMEIPCRLFYFPPLLLRITAGLLGKKKEINRLMGSLQVDITDTRELLNWEPPYSLDESLKRTVA